MVDKSEDDNGREYNNIFAKEDFEDNYEESTDDSSCEQVSCTTSEDNTGSSDESSFCYNNKKKISILTIFHPHLILKSWKQQE